ncbi:ABC transporter ATP-binding protein [Nocardia sp. NPDC058658]|uniref:ABC transporter ATP-binding protein n=1 Tax=Nocardia sp. NPDC058658 TaxID=3346580 RepID=UPI0036462885
MNDPDASDAEELPTATEENGLKQVGRLVNRSPEVRTYLRRAAALSAYCGVASVAGLTCVALAMGQLYDDQRSWGAAGWLLIGAAVGLTSAFGARWLADHLAHEASFALEVTLRRALAQALADMPLGAVQRLGAGRIKKVVHDDVKSLHNVVADGVPFIGSTVAQPIAALIVLGIVEWKLLVAVLLIVPIAMLCMSLMTRDYAEQRSRYNRANEEVNGAVVEFVQGMPVVRTFDDGGTSFRRFAVAVRGFTVAVGDWIAISRSSGVLTQLFIVPLPTLLLVAVTAVPMLAAGWISVPALVVALLIGAMPIEAVGPLMHLTNYLNDSKAGAARILDILAIAPLREPTHPRTPQSSSIALRSVGFDYGEDRGKPALAEVDIDIPAGTVCALVGPSGSGKSTVARLIPRFYDVTSGSVTIGGVDVRDIAGQVLLSQVALVFQEPFLIDATIADNIRLARPDATDEEVESAARAAAAHDFIVDDIPGGYAAHVGERGGSLSGGQRQRLTIARAILADAPIVILDEATAFADPENEAIIQEAIGRMMRGRTVLIIAHRLSTIVDVDQIVVLDEGRVVERGRHAQLVAAGGTYARLWSRHEQAARWGLGTDSINTAVTEVAR